MGHEITITKDNFQKDVLESSLPVLVDFWAVWCMPCKMMEPILEGLASETQGKLVVGKINVDEEPELAEKYGIVSIPTLIVFSKGAEAAKKVGAIPRHAIDDLVKEFIA